MRQVICYISILATGLVLAGCGQSGALHLPNDPNYDKRAKYLLYKNTETEPKASDEARGTCATTVCCTYRFRR